MSVRPIKVLLLVEDNLGDARLLREMLSESDGHGIEVSHVESLSAAETHLGAVLTDVVLLDLGLPDATGLEAIRRARRAAPRVPLVVLTGLDDSVLALRALQEGAQDYLVKGQIDTRGLLRALRYAVERNTAEEALFEEKERAEVTLKSIGDAVASTDIAGNITFLNNVAEKLTGWSSQEAAGKPVAEILSILDASGRQTVPDPMALAVDRDQTMHLPSSSVLVRRDGSRTPIEDSVAPIHDRQGQVVGAVIVFRDVSAARAMARQMAHSAEHDFLTGLPNRMLLNDRVGQAIAFAARHRTKVAVLFLDLDGFKHINDSLGHSVGDKLLQSVAQRLVDSVRLSDTVSRQGGDEFVVLLSEVDESEDAVIAAKRVLRAVAAPHSIDDRVLHITTSIGVSMYPDDGTNAETLIKNADTAMYQAKESGHQTFRFFMPAMNVRAVERQSIEEALRRAVERNEFSLAYQPIVDLRTGEISGAEALLRWNHPVRGSVPPMQFVPIAEECGLILPIGAWVLRNACAQAQKWIAAGLSLKTISVNVSAMEFRDDDFLPGLFAVVDQTGLDPRRLMLELTESVLVKRSDATVTILRTLHEKGISIALDDFGTGYSSLGYLAKFPVDALKIDQSFTREMTADGGGSIVTAVIAMARSLCLRVIAEGVETEAQTSFLLTQGCNEGQGFHFGRPMAPEEFGRLLSDSIPQGDIGTRAVA